MKSQTIITEKLCKKLKEVGFEPGSGAMFIPILGDLFPKLWGPKMREVSHYFFEINGRKISVDEDLYNMLEPGDEVKITYDKDNRIISLSA